MFQRLPTLPDRGPGRRLLKRIAVFHRSVEPELVAVASASWRSRFDVCRIGERSPSPWRAPPADLLRSSASPLASRRGQDTAWLVLRRLLHAERLDLVAAFAFNGSAIGRPGRVVLCVASPWLVSRIGFCVRLRDHVPARFPGGSLSKGCISIVPALVSTAMIL